LVPDAGEPARTVAVEAERFIGLANQRKRLLYRASSRTDITLGILAEAATDSDGRSIVFHESIDEIERLFLKAAMMKLPAVLEHSQLPDGLRAENIEAFRAGVARIIISAKSLAEGFNVPSADLGVIVASSSSVRQRIQSLGRMLRRKIGGRTAQVLVLYLRDTHRSRSRPLQKPLQV
jgi:superfamily II DNA or RNA helicase